MILSASRRTDLPCCYPGWILNRLRAGEVLVRNPVNLKQVSRVLLTSETVDCIVFWTKDPLPLMERFDELERMEYPFYFQFTLTPYGPDIEQGLRGRDKRAETFRALSRRLGSHRVHWRYDPVFFDSRYTLAFHKQSFRRLCETLEGSTGMVTISFLDLYRKGKHIGLQEPGAADIAEFSAFAGELALQHGITPQACCEAVDLSVYGIRAGSCISRETVERVCGYPIAAKPDKGQRPGCGCCESIDIGAYHTCTNGCVYCYATSGGDTAQRNRQGHDPCGELLVGKLQPEETVTLRRTESLRLYENLSLF